MIEPTHAQHDNPVRAKRSEKTQEGQGCVPAPYPLLDLLLGLILAIRFVPALARRTRSFPQFASGLPSSFCGLVGDVMSGLSGLTGGVFRRRVGGFPPFLPCLARCGRWLLTCAPT
jgi:hypothetical protein